MEPAYRLMLVQPCSSVHLIDLQGLYASISKFPDDAGASPVRIPVALKATVNAFGPMGLGSELASDAASSHFFPAELQF